MNFAICWIQTHTHDKFESPWPPTDVQRLFIALYQAKLGHFLTHVFNSTVKRAHPPITLPPTAPLPFQPPSERPSIMCRACRPDRTMGELTESQNFYVDDWMICGHESCLYPISSIRPVTRNLATKM